MTERNKISGVSLYIIGIGMGNPGCLTVEAAQAIEAAKLLVGAKRMLAPYEKEKSCAVSYRTEEIVEIIEEYIRTGAGNIAVLLSGDSGFYSGAKALLAALREAWGEETVQRRVIVLPGISSLSYFCAKIGKSWEDAELVNLHGAEENLWQAVLTHEKVFAVTGETRRSTWKNWRPTDWAGRLVMGGRICLTLHRSRYRSEYHPGQSANWRGRSTRPFRSCIWKIRRQSAPTCGDCRTKASRGEKCR